MFSQIGLNWRGEPLTSHEVMVRLIGRTTNASGLTVRAQLDRRKYPAGRKVSADVWVTIRPRPDRFHGDWNYTIHPRKVER